MHREPPGRNHRKGDCFYGAVMPFWQRLLILSGELLRYMSVAMLQSR
jgi:hypothetical protein